jgi:hypothetical protein
VIEALTAYPNDCDLCLFALEALSRLSTNGDNIAILWLIGGCEVIIKTMQSFMIDPDINQCGCEIIANLIFNENNCAKLGLIGTHNGNL